ncbi:MAG TPA: NlpC/P60 family protein [Rugosimonospora sp.]|nr:NlpC/P60 family protein [Rugosimonospora sp.]
MVPSDRHHPALPRATHPTHARILTLGTCLVAAVLALVSGRAALAAPSPGQVEAQINQAWNQLEPLIEQYDRVHAQLQANQAKAAALGRQIQPLQSQVDLAMSRVGVMSANLYKTGPAYRMAALITAGTPTSLLDQLTTVNQLARQQTDQVAAVAAQRDRYAAAKKPFDVLVAQLSAQDADLAARKNAIQAQLTTLQTLRQQAYGAGSAGTGALKPVASCPVEYSGDAGSKAAAKACSLIGKPYIWAAAGPTGYDCSGLTLTAWATVGVSLGHFTGWQWNETRPVTRTQLHTGDLVFFFPDHHHMGIYVGGGWMVHAPTTGDFVRMARIDSPYLPIAGYRRPG